MTLQEATAWALKAAEAGNLEDVAQALRARSLAIAGGQLPTPEVLTAGEQVVAAVAELKRQISHDSARLRQMQRFVQPAE